MIFTVVYDVCFGAMVYAALSSDAQVALITGIFALLNTIMLHRNNRTNRRLEQRQEDIMSKLHNDEIVKDDVT